MKNFIKSEWSLLEKKLVISTFFLLGIVIGFVFAPIKKGIYFCDNNGATLTIKKKK